MIEPAPKAAIEIETSTVRALPIAPVTSSRDRVSVAITPPVAVPKTVVELKPAFGAMDFAAAFAAALAEADNVRVTAENSDAVDATDATDTFKAVRLAREPGARDISDADATIVAETEVVAVVRDLSDTELDLLAMLEMGAAANVRNTLAAGDESKGKDKSKDKRKGEQAPEGTGGESRKLF
jgi:hypothetical protein